MIIVEYCPNGNLRDILMENRQLFIDQIIRDEDKIDSTIIKRTEEPINGSGRESGDEER